MLAADDGQLLRPAMAQFWPTPPLQLPTELVPSAYIAGVYSPQVTSQHSGIKSMPTSEVKSCRHVAKARATVAARNKRKPQRPSRKGGMSCTTVYDSFRVDSVNMVYIGLNVWWKEDGSATWVMHLEHSCCIDIPPLVHRA